MSTGDAGTLAPEEVEPADRVRRQSLPNGRGPGRPWRCAAAGSTASMAAAPACAVVDVVDVAVVADEHPRIMGGDRVRAEGADDAHQLLRSARSLARAPSGRCRKVTDGVAHEGRGLALLALPRGRQLQGVGVRIIGATVATGTAHELGHASLHATQRGDGCRPSPGRRRRGCGRDDRASPGVAWSSARGRVCRSSSSVASLAVGVSEPI